jgi:hypothetical protein
VGHISPLLELLSEAGKLLFQVGYFFSEVRYFVFQVRYTVGVVRVAGHKWGRRCLRDIGSVFHITRQQMFVAGFFVSGLSGKNSDQRGIALHQALQGGLHFSEVLEAMHELGAAAELPGGLGAA